MDEKGETVRKEKERRNAGDERFKVKHTNGVESSEGPLCLEPSPQESRARALLIIQLFAWILNSIKPSVSLLLLAQPPLPSFPPHRQKAVLLIFIENVSRRQGFRREREGGGRNYRFSFNFQQPSDFFLAGRKCSKSNGRYLIHYSDTPARNVWKQFKISTFSARV